jgi:hypothetical protein
MSSYNRINQTSNSAAAVALIGLIPIFLFIITYGWQKIFEGLGVFNDFTFAQYAIALLIALTGVVFARMVAAERLRVKYSENAHSPAVWIAYFILLFLVSALGSMNTLYFKLESRSALQDAFRSTYENFSRLNQAISNDIVTSEYDRAKNELDTQKTTYRKSFAEFLVQAEKDKTKQLEKFDDFKRKAISAWEQFESEMRNPARPGFGREAKRRFDELQAAVPDMRERAGSFDASTASKMSDLLAQYKQNFENALNRRGEEISKSCTFSPETISKLNILRDKIPEIRPLPEATLKCSEVDNKIAQWTSDFDNALNRMTVQQSQAEMIRVAFKQNSSDEILKLMNDNANMSLDQNKITLENGRPFLEGQWRTYEKLFLEYRNLHPNPAVIKISNQIVIPEIRFIGQIGNVFELFLRRWDHLSTYLILLMAVSFDLILITFYSRYLRGKLEEDEIATSQLEPNKTNGSAKIL